MSMRKQVPIMKYVDFQSKKIFTAFYSVLVRPLSCAYTARYAVKRCTICVAVFCMLFVFTSCEIMQEQSAVFRPTEFHAQTETAEQVSMPAALPEEACGFFDWTRESEWIKIASVSSLDTALYANRDNRKSIFLRANEQFVQFDWENIRESESDSIRLYQYDLDGDKADEIIAILGVNGGTHWKRDELHIIENNGDGEWTDRIFPLDAYWTWVTEHMQRKDMLLTFFDSDIKLNNPNIPLGKELASALHVSSVKVDAKTIMIETEIESGDLAATALSIAILEAVIHYDGENFNVVSYELDNFE